MEIKILWIDDDPHSVEDYINIAKTEEGIETDFFESWEEAKGAFIDNYADYSTIILDCNCKLKQNSAPTDQFLPQVLEEIREHLASKKHDIPIIIITEGSIADFDIFKKYTIRNLKCSLKSDVNQNWLHNLLIENAAKNENYKIKKIYSSVFEVLEGEKIKRVDPNHESQKILLNILSYLHFPEEHIEFDLKEQYNSIRRILEYVAQRIFLVEHLQRALTQNC